MECSGIHLCILLIQQHLFKSVVVEKDDKFWWSFIISKLDESTEYGFNPTEPILNFIDMIITRLKTATFLNF